ncbi:MAG: hypothetical protein ACFFCX_05830 [Candidatus Sifarchaeia archaeon]
MRWSGRGTIGFAYLKFRHFLPTIMKMVADEFIQIQTPTRKQLAEIEVLGKRMGLDRKEIHAATNFPINNEYSRKRRLTPFSVFIMVLVIMMIAFVVLVLAGYFPRPPEVYGAGPRYGSIKPKDFILD